MCERDRPSVAVPSVVSALTVRARSVCIYIYTYVYKYNVYLDTYVHIHTLHTYINKYIFFLPFFLILTMLALTLTVFALIRIMLALILRKARSDSQFARTFSLADADLALRIGAPICRVQNRRPRFFKYKKKQYAVQKA